MGDVRSTPGTHSQLLALTINRPGTLAPWLRANAPTKAVACGTGSSTTAPSPVPATTACATTVWVVPRSMPTTNRSMSARLCRVRDGCNGGRRRHDVRSQLRERAELQERGPAPTDHGEH